MRLGRWMSAVGAGRRRTAAIIGCAGILLLSGPRLAFAEESAPAAAAEHPAAQNSTEHPVDSPVSPAAPAIAAEPPAPPATAPAATASGATTAPVAAATARSQTVDAVLVIDSSGSMKETDPKRLRVPAAKMFISLLDADDRVGLISFSDNGYPITHLTAAAKSNQTTLFAGVDKVSQKGAYTNLYAALEKGADMLRREGDSERRRMLVLMSDGKMDTGDFEQDKALIAKIRSETIQALATDGIEVYTIAFTESSDMPLLREIAERTAALSRLASNDRELHEVFSQIFESAKQPDMLPMDGGAFTVDASIEEVTVVASKATPDAEIKLQMPDGRKIVAANAGKAVRWFKSDQFDMITVEKPPVGQWHLLSSDNRGDKAYVVTKLGLDARVGEAPIYVDAELTGEAWLNDADEIITKPEILGQTQLQIVINAADGKQQEIALADSGQNGDRAVGDGVFANRLSFAQPGQHQVHVIAKSPNFQREKAIIVEVAEPKVEVAPAPAPAAETAPATQPETPPTAEHEATTEAVAQPAQEPAPAEPPKQAHKGMNIGLIISVFVLVNVLIGAGIGGFLFWRRRKAAKAAAAAEATDDEHESKKK